jgi:hypothetical protein
VADRIINGCLCGIGAALLFLAWHYGYLTGSEIKAIVTEGILMAESKFILINGVVCHRSTKRPVTSADLEVGQTYQVELGYVDSAGRKWRPVRSVAWTSEGP